MKIAHVVAVYPPYKGGIGHVAYDYVEFLKGTDDDVTVFTPQYRDLEFESGVRALKGVVTFGKAAILPQLLWELKRFDVIHLHYPFYGGAIFATLAALVWKKRLILTYHMKTQGSGVIGFIFRLHRKLVEPFILKIADIVLVSSTDYADSIDLKHKNLIDMPFGVDTRRFNARDKELIRDRMSIPRDAFVFIFVGGLDDAHYFKGVDVLLEAVSKIRSNKSWKLLIVGGGNRQQQLEKIAQDLRIEGNVIFAGRVSDEELPDCYRVADVHILPSIDQSEAFGLVTLEAAATGLPSFVSALPGVRSLVVHKITGLHLPIDNPQALGLALLWALDHREKCQELGLAAFDRVKKLFSDEICLKQLHGVYKGGKLD